MSANDTVYHFVIPYARTVYTAFCTWKDAPRITHLANGYFNERGEAPAASELVLYAEAALCAEVAGPLLVDLSFEVECVALVGEVPGHDEEDESDPQLE